MIECTFLYKHESMIKYKRLKDNIEKLIIKRDEQIRN